MYDNLIPGFLGDQSTILFQRVIEHTFPSGLLLSKSFPVHFVSPSQGTLDEGTAKRFQYARRCECFPNHFVRFCGARSHRISSHFFCRTPRAKSNQRAVGKDNEVFGRILG